MPAIELTAEQGEWTLQFLQILGKQGASDVDLYGGGYTETDQREVFPALKDALKPEVPPALISADQWLKASMGPTETQKTSFNQVEVFTKLNDGGRAAQELSAVIDNWSKLNEAMKNGFAGPWPLTLPGPPSETIAQPVGAVQKNNLVNKKQSLVNDYQVKNNKNTECQAAARECMPFVDAPANNPERQKVGQRLKEMEQLEKDQAKAPRPLTKEQLGKHMQQKAKKLQDLERELFAWNNRRIQQNLPPSAEAVGMADLLQRVHQKMTEDIIDNDLDITPADADNLSPEENEELQRTWRTLRNDAFRDPSTPAQGKLQVAPTAKPPAATAEELKKFRIETLSNCIRLMGSSAGRHIVKEINSGSFPVTIEPTTAAGGASCTRIGDGHLRSTTGVKGGGGTSAVNMVLGAKDSDVGLGTASGNKLFAPRFIAMGHELIHALHNTRGSNRREVNLPDTLTAEEKKHWNNAEEYRTIFEGKTSEQTLRSQYGLSAERFGHISRGSQQGVFDSLKETLEAQTELATPGNTIDRTLKNYAWNPEQLGDKLKVALAKELNANKAPVGPLPEGWDVDQLTVEQIKGILEKRIPYKLDKLVWTPYGLTVERLKQITDTNEHHPRSPLHIRFVKLGAGPALAAIGPFNTATGSKLSTGSDTDWPTKVQALEDAEKLLLTIGTINPTLGTAAATPGKLQAKLNAVASAATSGTAGGNVKELAIEQFWQKLTTADRSKLTRAALIGTYGEHGFVSYKEMERALQGFPDVAGATGKPAAERATVMKEFAQACGTVITTCTAAVTTWIDTTAAERLQSNFGSSEPPETFKNKLKQDIQKIVTAAQAVQKTLQGVAALA